MQPELSTCEEMSTSLTAPFEPVMLSLKLQNNGIKNMQAQEPLLLPSRLFLFDGRDRQPRLDLDPLHSHSVRALCFSPTSLYYGCGDTRVFSLSVRVVI